MTGTRVVDDDVAQYPLHVLREYALLADGERGALVGPRGDLVWMCAPRWDSDAVFSSLIGGRGMYAVTPADARFVLGGYYEAGSLIWHSRWVTESGVIECRESLALPGDADRVIVLRRIIAVQGDARVTVRLDAHAGFGRHRLGNLHRDGDIWTGKTGKLHLRWSGAEAAGPDTGASGAHVLSMDLKVPAGSHHDLVLELSEHALPATPTNAQQAWTSTEHAWRDVVPEFPDSLAPHDTRHAYAVLRGLTSSGGGGMVAAATMSLPERAGQGRNYDYRYVWIRDQCLAGEAIAAAGAHPLMDDAVRFVAAGLLDDGPHLAPAYTSLGGRVLDQRSLDLPGGCDFVGNHVNAQFQLDALGESLLLLAAAARHDHLDADGWRAIETGAGAIASRWGDPEAGIWELDDQRWSRARLICVAGLRAVSRAPGAPASRTGEWLALAEAILAETSAHCTHPLAAGSEPRETRGWTRRCCYLASGVPFPSAIPAPPQPSRLSARSWTRRAMSTAFVSSPVRSATPKAPSCSAASARLWPATNRATRSRQPATSNATGPHAAPPPCSPRSTT